MGQPLSIIQSLVPGVIMKRATFSVAVIASCMLLASALSSQSETQTDEYARQLSLAQGYMAEHRPWEAVFPLQKAYDLKPNPDLLSRIGKAYLASGRATEAEIALTKVISEGAAVPFEFHHEHGGSGCIGTLYLTSGEIRWQSIKQEENFEANIAEIENLDWFTFSDFSNVRGTALYLKLRLRKKTWRLDYLLYGHGEYTYASGKVVYSGFDVQTAVKAHTFIVQFIRKASSIPVNRPTGAGDAVSRTKSSSQQAESSGQAQPSSTELRIGQSPEEVEKLLGKPDDRISVKDTLIYFYATVRVFFENGKLVKVEPRNP